LSLSCLSRPARAYPLRVAEAEVMEGAEAEAEVMEGAGAVAGEAVIAAPEGMLAADNPLTAAAACPIPPIMVLTP
jgi:hypothetical protein